MENIVEHYKSDFNKYDDFRIKAEVLIRELLIQSNINYHKIESRLKSPNKLEEKIIRKNSKYEKLTEITDLIGIRIITYFEDEVDKIAHIIQSEFELDKFNSIDKRMTESDRFGYKSLHYVATINTSRKKLTEYKRFADLKIEIQIRSILQHAWAEIEHDIGYKGELSIPDTLRRNFYRVAALLETADIEFVNIKNKLQEYEKEVSKDIRIQPENVDLNFASLKSFITNNPLVKELDKKIAEENEFTLTDSLSDVAGLLEKLYFLNIKNIKQLDTLLKETSLKIPAFAKYWFGETKSIPKSSLSRGISIFYLCYVIVGRMDNIEFANTYFNNIVMKNSSAGSQNRGEEIINVYKSIK